MKLASVQHDPLAQLSTFTFGHAAGLHAQGI